MFDKKNSASVDVTPNISTVESPFTKNHSDK